MRSFVNLYVLVALSRLIVALGLLAVTTLGLLVRGLGNLAMIFVDEGVGLCVVGVVGIRSRLDL